MEKKVFGYPEFSAEGEQILCTYENEYRDMLMDIRVYRMKDIFPRKRKSLPFYCFPERLSLSMKGRKKKEAERMSLQKVPMRCIFPREKRF